MPSRLAVCYFGAGPARLPTSVLSTASAALLNYNNTGLGLVEHSHRTPLSANIIAQAAAHFKTLLSIPTDDSYTVLFMQGGGSTQFSAVVYNLVGYWVQKRLQKHGGDLEKVKEDLKDMKCEYVLTGGWSLKVSEEAARLLGEEHVAIVADPRQSNDDKKWGAIPEEKDWKLVEKKNSAFTYFCDNETVDGIEFPAFPEALGEQEDDEYERLVVADMSSNILSRPIDVKRYALVFAAAQKNLGIPGLTIVLIRKSILDCQPEHSTLRELGLGITPIMMDYPTIAEHGSIYNTLPIFDVYVASEVMSQLIASGGINATAKAAQRKCSQLYDFMKEYEIFTPMITDTRIRSRINICFNVKGQKDGQDLEKQFLDEAERQGLLGIKGHRSIGGVRVSCYNAVREDEVARLVAFMKDFAKEHS